MRLPKPLSAFGPTAGPPLALPPTCACFLIAMEMTFDEQTLVNLFGGTKDEIIGAVKADAELWTGLDDEDRELIMKWDTKGAVELTSHEVKILGMVTKQMRSRERFNGSRQGAS